MNQVPNHIAILVPSVIKAADFLGQFGFHIGKAQQFEAEGTNEIYVEENLGNSLLLIEAREHGPYRRALNKRGPGLHHIAIDVLNLSSYIESISESGWFLHPASIKTITQSKTAYLARPGFPALIEVQERNELSSQTLFVREIALKMDPSVVRLLRPIGLDSLIKPTLADEAILIGNKTILLKNLF